MKPKRIAELIAEVYEAFLDETESFEACGIDLAYLLGAIAVDQSVEWNSANPGLAIVSRRFPTKHRVWKFIQVEANQR